MDSQKHILITGGAGFIGSHIADRCLKDGWKVRILDNLDPKVHPEGKPGYVPAEAEFIKGDATDHQTLSRALKGVSHVSVQAAYQDYLPHFSKFFHTNVTGTGLLYEIIVKENLPIEKVVLASSQMVHGEGQYKCTEHGFFLADSRDPKNLEKGIWEVECPRCRKPAEALMLKEEFPNPHNQYSISKYSQELTALRLGKLYNIPTVALRYSIVQGPRQSLYNRYSGAMRIFTSQILSGQAPTVYEDGNQTRDFVHVSDVVDAHMLALEKPEMNFQMYNVGSGSKITLKKFAELLVKKSGKNLEPRITGEYRVGDNRHSISDISKLKTLGWQPRMALENNVEDFLGWVDSIGGIPQPKENAEEVMRKMGVLKKSK